MSDEIRFTFMDSEAYPATGPDDSHLPPGEDADRGISAEIAVERGDPTPEQEAFVQALKEDQEQHDLFRDGNTTEVTVGSEAAVREALQRGGPLAVSNFIGAGGMLSNPDGTFTFTEDARPDPRKGGNR